jgi:hypothetical protein
MPFQQQQPDITTTLSMSEDGTPMVTFNSKGKNYSVDRMLVVKMIQACQQAKFFPRPTKAVTKTNNH